MSASHAIEAGPVLLLDGRLRPGKQPDWQEAFLPSPCVQNHAANLLELRNGDLACVWFGGTQEGMADISIHLSRLPTGSDTWTAAEKVSDDPARSEQNPILFYAPDERLHLIWTSQRSGNQDTAVVRVRVSDDHGASWGPIGTLIDEPGTFVRQPPVFTEADDWLLPVFLCRTRPGEKWVGDNDLSAVKRSTDGGRSWTTTDVPDSLGCVHMSIVADGKGQLAAFYRSRWADFIYRSFSEDGGLTWSAPLPTTLPNNNASIQAATLADGRLALIYNHSSAANAAERRLSLYDEIEDNDTPAEPSSAPRPAPARTAFWGAPRAPVSIAVSDDTGLTWTVRQEIETGSGYCMNNNSREKLNRELSYPTILQASDGRIHAAFTYFRQAIKHVVLPASALE